MMFLIAIVCVAMLAACRGKGSDNETSNGNNPQDNIFHHFELVNTDTSTQLKMSLATDGCAIHLVRNGVVASLAIMDVDKIILEGAVIGYVASGGGKSVFVTDVSAITIDGIAAADAILVTVVAKNGDKYFVNPDWVTFDGSAPMIMRNGIMYYGAMANDQGCVSTPTTTVVSIPTDTTVTSTPTDTNVNTTPTPTIPAAEPMIEISILNGDLQIKFPIVDGYIIDLVKDGIVVALKTSDVHRVFWNGDNAGWSLSDSNPYSGPLNLPVTGLVIPAHDNGIIRIVDINGNVYSINTDKETGLPLTNDGRQLLTF